MGYMILKKSWDRAWPTSILDFFFTSCPAFRYYNLNFTKKKHFFMKYCLTNYSSCRFLNLNNFSNLNYNCSKISKNNFKKHSVIRNCSDLSLFEQIVQVISKILKILGFQVRISSFSRSLEQFFLTVYSGTPY